MTKSAASVSHTASATNKSRSSAAGQSYAISQSQLTKQALDLGITGTTHFLGFKSNPFKYLVKSDVYVLSSKWERVKLNV